MNVVERQYFNELTKDRMESANVLEKPSLSGVQHSVVEKYSDQAHFIYELLQNADDVEATEARFYLFRDKLVFIHNGKKQFNVTNPRTEADDASNGQLGHVNAITSIANSAKNGNKATIGKFGVGFKAVFQYTNTPHIYDPNVAFKIERFIVPQLLNDDYPSRKKDETVFVFPFDHSERSAEEAFEDISDKLRSLVYPILFLKHLCDVSFEIEDIIGMYEKTCVLRKDFGHISAEKLELSYIEKNNIITDSLWLFSQKDSYDRNFSVGFFVDENQKLKPVNMPAFCYFPTKEDTKLHFIIHAPFLLTDSREGIKAGEEHNRKMILLLARLSADALLCLHEIGKEDNVRIIDDNILNIIPFDENEFTNIDNKTKISFLPFYNSIKQALKRGLLPTKDGCVSGSDAYWSNTLDLNALFSDEQISNLIGTDNAHWVFCSKPRHALDAYGKTMLRDYIDDLVSDWIDERDIFSHLDKEFVEKQSLEWLHKFYKWISDTPRRFNWDLKSSPIFINEYGEAVAAYDRNGQRTLFLPSMSVRDCPTIHPDFLHNEDTKKFLLDVVKLEEPSLQDYIYNTVIPNFKHGDNSDAFSYFKLFFSYYKECRATEIDDYIDKIKELDFLEYIDKSGNRCRCKANELYYPDSSLVEYFVAKPDTRFIALDLYTEAYPNDNYLSSFLNELGVMHYPNVYHYNLPIMETLRNNDLPKRYSTQGHRYSEKRIDGCMELIEYVASNMFAEKSYLLWNMLVTVLDNNSNVYLGGEYEYFYYNTRLEFYTSLMEQKLQEEKWLIDKDGNFVSSTQIKLSELSPEYETTSYGAQRLIRYLSFIEEVEDEALTEEEKLAFMCKKYGIESEADFKEFQEWKKQKEIQQSLPIDDPADVPSGESKNSMDTIAKDISKRAKKQRQKRASDISSPLGEMHVQSSEVEEVDRDEFTPGAIDYSAKIENQKEKQADELQELAQMQEFQDIAISTDKYSYLWFKTLLDMEILNSDVDSISNREVNISFGKIEKEEGTQKTYILKHPNKYIPQYMEDLSDIPLAIRMKDGSSKSVAIEVSSVQSYNLHVKLKDADGLTGTDLSNVQEISIKATRPVFLLQALKEKFAKLQGEDGEILDDDYNLKENLPDNLEFVFGPPGTGKTTYLANKVLTPLMQKKDNLKVLVLTPTNKAADVITTRIMDTMGEDTSYTDWLIRFGITGDERVENSEVFRDKTFDLRSFPRSVTITTIARFAYDFFMPKNERLYLDALNWDYIVIDEASMIPIVQILYPIFRKTPEKFIIAGDPFQIEPITTVDLWAGENIYKLVELNSFTNPKTVPYDYSVVKLTTQYRSTPEIGEVFSKFTYGGILQHNRTSDSRRNLHLDGIIDIDSLNVLKFPVSKYESIYRSKRLNGTTPYQTYSAIFTMEFANFLSKALSERNPGETFNIGIVAPYKAQASLIDRLMSSVTLPDSVKVQVGTIHGFQGDECDIVFVVLNTPPGITSSPKLFLNKQNVLNVAISRSKDYLFVIMPDNQTDNIFKLQKIKKIEDLMRHSGHFTEQTTSSVEKIIFDDEKFIENNSFATSHQTVNVYGQPEKRYEVRSEDTAVDVQVHRGKGSMQEIPAAPVQEETIKPQIAEPTPKTETKTGISIGDKVKHKLWGQGLILSLDESKTPNIMEIEFSIGVKRLQYPNAFEGGFLSKV